MFVTNMSILFGAILFTNFGVPESGAYFLLTVAALWAFQVYYIRSTQAFTSLVYADFTNEIKRKVGYLSDDPGLQAIYKQYIENEENIHNINYNLFGVFARYGMFSSYYHRPKYAFRAILNKYGILKDYKRLVENRKKLHDEYFLLFNLIKPEDHEDRLTNDRAFKHLASIKTLKNRNTKSNYNSNIKYTVTII